MKIMSLINEKEIYVPEFDDAVSLHPEQLVINALEVLLDNDREALPVRKNGVCVGIIYTKDLIWFLTNSNKEYNLLFHKFNFDLNTAVAMMHLK
jgi:CBS domain-containing protein